MKSYKDPEKLLEFIQDKPILDGRLIRNIDVSTTTINVNHGLGRRYQGFIVVRASANTTVFDEDTNFRGRILALQASNVATISIWVF